MPDTPPHTHHPQHDAAPTHCTACGSPEVEPRAIGSLHRRCRACGVSLWRNAIPVAGALVIREGRILLVRRSRDMDRGPGGWVFPGGFVERGETPWDAAVRETFEEAGVAPRLIAPTWPQTVIVPHHIVMPFVAALDGDAEPWAGPESDEVRWFAPAEIPWRDIPFSTTLDALHRLVSGEEVAGDPAAVAAPAVARVADPLPHRPVARHCPRCGTPLRPAGEDELGLTRCDACNAPRWENPRVTAGFLPVRDGRILLGQRRAETDGGGRWAIPSGHMDPGETPVDTALRELLEEAGVTARAERLAGIFAGEDHVEIVYTGPVDAIEPPYAPEFEALDWFTVDEAAALPLHHSAPHLIEWAVAAGLVG